MKVVKPGYEIIGEVPTGPKETIELIEAASRVCYKSEDKITKESAPILVNKLIKRRHFAMIEHSNIVFRQIKPDYYLYTEDDLRLILKDRAKYHTIGTYDGVLHVSGNLRAWMETIEVIGPEHHFIADCELLLSQHLPDILGSKLSIKRAHAFELVTKKDEIPMEMKRIAVKFIVDRGISHEIVRHRPCSFAQESTRYCRYADGIHVIMPPGLTSTQQIIWRAAMLSAEKHYLALLADTATEKGARAEIARSVLPKATKAEIFVTADLKEWHHIFFLRCAAGAHPQMREVMIPLKKDFQDKGWALQTFGCGV